MYKIPTLTNNNKTPYFFIQEIPKRWYFPFFFKILVDTINYPNRPSILSSTVGSVRNSGTLLNECFVERPVWTGKSVPENTTRTPFIQRTRTGARAFEKLHTWQKILSVDRVLSMWTKCFSISYVYSRCFEFQNKYFSKHMKSRNVENHVWDGCLNKKQ